MNDYERIKILRKELGLTLEKFGGRLGVTKVAISNIENGKRALTDQMFTAICREFKVNPEWLRNGEGEMHITMTRNESIAFFVEELMKEADDSFKLRLVDILSKLDEDEWEVLGNLAKRLAEEDK